MPIRAFPDPRRSTPEGIVALGGDLHPDSMRLAYRSGIFPWPIEGLPLCWFCPPERAILEFSSLHLPRSVRRERRRAHFRYTIDQAFRAVISGCAEMPRRSRDSDEPESTWITPDLLEAYCELHRLGEAHSVEAWLGGALAGGVIGVSIGGTFSAETMFHREPGASKLALLYLVDHLAAHGLDWMDVQVMSPLLRLLGARNEPRDAFLKRLKGTQERRLVLFDPPCDA
jgi:leucyl/phenylalanyl-tRNA--protein transferase